MDLFVYGTLVDPSVMRSVTDRVFPQVNARLRDFRRFHRPGSYPYILPAAGAVVDGLILCEIDATSLGRLDAYEREGDLYVRQEVTVDTDSGPRRCSTYVGNPQAVARLRIA